MTKRTGSDIVRAESERPKDRKEKEQKKKLKKELDIPIQLVYNSNRKLGREKNPLRKREEKEEKIMESPVMQEEFQGHTIKIYQDENPMNPRDEENLGKMVCFHERYDIGDKTDYKSKDFYYGLNELYQRIKKDHSPVVICPVYLFDHSGLSVSLDAGTFRAFDPQRWDWGQVGFIFVSQKKAIEEFPEEFKNGECSEEFKTRLGEWLTDEIETYNKYLQGEVYGFVIENQKGETVESCWGFYDQNECMEEAKENCPDEPIDFEINTEIVFNTVHVSDECYEALKAVTNGDFNFFLVETFSLSVSRNALGFQIFCYNEEYKDVVYKTGFEELDNLLKIGQEQKCKWLTLSSDGPVYERIPFFQKSRK